MSERRHRTISNATNPRKLTQTSGALDDRHDVTLGVLEPRALRAPAGGDAVRGFEPGRVVLQERDAACLQLRDFLLDVAHLPERLARPRSAGVRRRVHEAGGAVGELVADAASDFARGSESHLLLVELPRAFEIRDWNVRIHRRVHQHESLIFGKRVFALRSRLGEPPLGEGCMGIAGSDVGGNLELERPHVAKINDILLDLARRRRRTEGVLLPNNVAPRRVVAGLPAKHELLHAARLGSVEDETDELHATRSVEAKANDLGSALARTPSASVVDSQGALDGMRGLLRADLNVDELLDVEPTALRFLRGSDDRADRFSHCPFSE